MTLSRRVFFKNIFGILLPVAVAYFVSTLFGLYYRGGLWRRKLARDTAKRRRVNRIHNRKSVNAFFLNPRSGVVHWPGTFDKRQRPKGLPVRPVSAEDLIQQAQKQSDAGTKKESSHLLASIASLGTGENTDYSRIFSNVQFPYRSLAEVLCLATPGLMDTLKATRKRTRCLAAESATPKLATTVGESQACSNMTFRFPAHREPIITEYVCLALIDVKPSNGTLEFSNLDLAIRILQRSLPFPLVLDDDFADRDFDSSGFLFPSVKYYLRNYSLCARLISVFHADNHEQAFAKICSALRRPQLEFGHVDPAKWKWLTNEQEFKKWHNRSISKRYMQRLATRITAAKEIVMGNGSSSGKDTFGRGRFESDSEAHQPHKCIPLRFRHLWRRRLTELRHQFSFLPSRKHSLWGKPVGRSKLRRVRKRLHPRDEVSSLP